MPVSRERKEQLINQLSEDLKKAQALIITDYRGLPTADLAKPKYTKAAGLLQSRLTSPLILAFSPRGRRNLRLSIGGRGWVRVDTTLLNP